MTAEQWRPEGGEWAGPAPVQADDPDPFAPSYDPTGTTAVGVLFEAAHMILRGLGQLVTAGGSVDEMYRLIEAVAGLEEAAVELRDRRAA